MTGRLLFDRALRISKTLLASLIIPQETALHANYPNPFNPETWIPYQLTAAAEVTLTIYDMNGGAVRRLEGGASTGGHCIRAAAARCILGRPQWAWRIRRQWFILLHIESGRVHGNPEDVD